MACLMAVSLSLDFVWICDTQNTVNIKQWHTMVGTGTMVMEIAIFQANELVDNIKGK